MILATIRKFFANGLKAAKKYSIASLHLAIELRSLIERSLEINLVSELLIIKICRISSELREYERSPTTWPIFDGFR